jgi:hypothetical protein
VFYRFFFERPSLIVTVQKGQRIRYEDKINCQIDFKVENVGRKYAENSHITLTLFEWQLSEELEPDLRVQVHPPEQEQEDLSPLNIRSEVHRGTLDPDDEQEFVRLFIDDIIHKRKSFKIHSGVKTFDTSRQYKINYTTACQGHKPRNGTIIVEPDIDSRDISISHFHPTKKRRLVNYMSDLWKRIKI